MGILRATAGLLVFLFGQDLAQAFADLGDGACVRVGRVWCLERRSQAAPADVPCQRHLLIARRQAAIGHQAFGELNGKKIVARLLRRPAALGYLAGFEDEV